MSNEAFNKYTLRSMLKGKDFFKDHLLIHTIESVIAESMEISTLGYAPPLQLLKTPFKGKTTYKFSNLPDEIVIRKINYNIKKKTRVKQRNRDEIVANISLLLQEGISYTIYKLDVKSFYESFDIDDILEKIQQENSFDPITKKLSISFLRNYKVFGGNGLPRGMQISATLSEYMMSSFDRHISRISFVMFYARYVDDIVIITSGEECKNNFISSIENSLPKGLKLNKNKQSINSVDKVKPVDDDAKSKIQLQFDYLGYKFTVCDPLRRPKVQDGNHLRQLKIDLAESKLNKIKFRIIKSFIDYYKKGDYTLLKNRIKLLTHNYNVYDRSKGIRINVGIYSSYHRINHQHSNNLINLDKFLSNVIFSNGFKNSIKYKLSTAQKQELAKCSFYSGFVNKSFIYFSPDEQKRIQKCWIYAY